MDPDDIREMTSEEIEQRIEDEYGEIRKLEFNHAVAPLDNPMILRQKRRDIARMKTILRERELSDEEVDITSNIEAGPPEA